MKKACRALGAIFTLAMPVIAAAQNGPSARVVVASVQATEIAPTVGIPGTVLSRFDSRLASEVEGRVLWFADVGTVVTEGEPLVRLESTMLEIQREELLAALDSQEGRLTFLEPEVERLRQLTAQSNAAQSLFDRTLSDLQVARADLEAARARLRQVEDQIAKTTIPAPFDGVVSERLVNLGEMINRLDVVMRLVSPAAIEIVTRAPLNAVAFLEAGAQLHVHNDYREGTGVVRTIVPFGDPQSHMFEVRIDVPADSWIVGESVRLEVPTAERRPVLAIPRDALVLRAEGTFVFRIDTERAAQRIPVNVGAGDGQLVEVTGDLSAGDLIVVRGGERLAEGQQVVVAEG